MTNYSHILPANAREAQTLLSSCGGTHAHHPFDRAYLELDEASAVTLRVHTHYSANDAVPMDIWHGRTRQWQISGNTDADWLRDQLNGGEVAALLDRVRLGHTVDWDGGNNVGHLTYDASEAAQELDDLLFDAPLSDLAVMTAETWLWGNMGAREVARNIEATSSTPETLVADAAADDIVISDGIDGMRKAIADVMRQAREDEDAA
jgi:hypothetical protein